jgi:cobalt transporter subunit CbtB
MSTQITAVTSARSVTVSKGLQLFAAFLLGAVILYGAGFAQASAVHNAAHDMRHSQGFPCH